MIREFHTQTGIGLFPAAVFLLVLLGVQIVSGAVNESGKSDKRPEGLVCLPMGMNAVIVEKSSQQLFLFSSDTQGVYERFRVPCSTGAAPGRKSRSGDRKTPEGVYFLTDEYEDRYLSAVYGEKAFPTDYPNLIDRRKGRAGSAIWLHGTNKPLRPMDSNGCVAMNNRDIVRIAPYLVPGVTPVVLTDTLFYAEPATIDREKQALLSLVLEWEQALESGTDQAYLLLYDPDYPPQIQWWKIWSAMRQCAAQKNLNFNVSIDSPGIFKEGALFVIFFNMELVLGDQHQTLGKRKLFVEKKGADYRITGDLFQTFPKGEMGDIGILAEAAESLYFRDASAPLLQGDLNK